MGGKTLSKWGLEIELTRNSVSLRNGRGASQVTFMVKNLPTDAGRH